MVVKDKLILYIPYIRWYDVKHLLPPSYTVAKAEGHFNGEVETTYIVTILNPTHMYEIRKAVTEELLKLGESEVLTEIVNTEGIFTKATNY